MMNLSVVGPFVAMALIAVLVKQYMQLRFQFHDYKHKQEELQAKTASCLANPQLEADSQTTGLTTVVMAETPRDRQTSGWCFQDGFCHFKNLCYSSPHQDFVVFHGNQSLFDSVPHDASGMIVDLSSVRNHNTQQARLVSLPVNANVGHIHWVDQTTLLFKRFKPDNLMHFFHDDILPLYHTLRLVTMTTRTNLSAPFDVHLVLYDDFELGEFSNIYRIISSHNLSLREDLDRQDGMTCYSDVYLGVSSATTWYQYGFSEPQGPIPGHQANGDDIHSAVHFILENLELGNKEQVIKSSNYLVLLTREENRKIINEVELAINIAREVGIKVFSVNYESYSLSRLIHTVRGSRGLLAMHGSLLVLAAFLKPGSVVIELYPYAVNSEHYTPYRTLATLPNMDLVYRSWTNQNKENSIGHPDWSPELGGLAHLSEEKRNEILQQSEVPVHLCCEDPSWLYHIYQDTVVDIDTVTSLVQSAIQASRTTPKSHNSNFNFNPSAVRNVSCVINQGDSNNHNSDMHIDSLTVLWTPPWSIKYLRYSAIAYDVLVQGTRDSKVWSYRSREPALTTGDQLPTGTYHVWVRCVLDSAVGGIFSDAVQCH